VEGRTVGNRFCVLPMEGWDGTPDGRPSELTVRRWKRFGEGGAKLIWGGEAVAVRHDGRANPNQLVMTEANLPGIADLRTALIDAHRAAHGRTDDLLVGLQLTHSGRFARPREKTRLEPTVLYRHPVLDRRFRLPADRPVMTDDEIARLVADFVAAAALARKAGYDFVDVKHCHGYLGHEFLSAVDRPGRYGGGLENRTRFLREVVAGIRAEAPGLAVGVRVSAADWLPFKPGPGGRGEPDFPDGHGPGQRYPYAFGGDGTGLGVDLTEPAALLGRTGARSVLVCPPATDRGRAEFAVSLARTLASAGKRTLLVDADFRRRRVTRMMQLDDVAGLADALNRPGYEPDPSRVAEGLHVLPAGAIVPDPGAAALHPRLPGLIQRLSDAYDVALVSGGPLLPNADSRALASAADAVILTVWASSDRSADLAESAAVVRECGGRLLGAVMFGVGPDVRYRVVQTPFIPMLPALPAPGETAAREV
jgi:hypothetical protein